MGGFKEPSFADRQSFVTPATFASLRQLNYFQTGTLPSF